MGYTRFPNGIESFGVPVFGSRNSDIVTGNVFFVDSGHNAALDAVNGGQRDTPFATLDYAVGQCTASNGDVIYVLPGHAESLTLADAVDIDVAGVSVIGLGQGTDRPTFTYTAVAGEIVVGADNVLIENIVCNASEPTVLLAIDIEDGVNYTTIRNCKFGVDTANTDEFNAIIHFTNNSTGAVVEGCVLDAGLGASVAGIHLDADTESLTIRNNRIHGDYSTGCIVGDTTLSTELLIQGNLLQNGDTGGIGTEPCIELLTGTTGLVVGNVVMCNLVANDNAIVGDAIVNINNVYSETVGATVGIADSHAAVT